MNSVKVKKVKFSMFPSKIMSKVTAHNENLRKVNDIGLLKDRRKIILRKNTSNMTKGRK